jgi:hypothetical protein
MCFPEVKYNTGCRCIKVVVNPCPRSPGRNSVHQCKNFCHPDGASVIYAREQQAMDAPWNYSQKAWTRKRAAEQRAEFVPVLTMGVEAGDCGNCSESDRLDFPTKVVAFSGRQHEVPSGPSTCGINRTRQDYYLDQKRMVIPGGWHNKTFAEACIALLASHIQQLDPQIGTTAVGLTLCSCGPCHDWQIMWQHNLNWQGCAQYETAIPL